MSWSHQRWESNISQCTDARTDLEHVFRLYRGESLNRSVRQENHIILEDSTMRQQIKLWLRKTAVILFSTCATAVMAANTSNAAADPAALVDKAVQALGGVKTLAQVKAVTWKEKGTFAFQGNDIPFTAQVAVQGTDHIRREWNLGLSGMNVGGVVVVSGERAWSKMMGNVEELAGEKLADERRRVYLTVIPITVLPLKSEGYTLAAIADEQVGDRPAAGLKVTPPDGKEFRLYFDKETGLPVRLVANVVDQRGAGEYTEETTFGDYQAFDGVRKATRISIKRDGEKSNDVVIREFKVLDRVDAQTFEKLSSSQPAAVPVGTIPKPRPITDPKVALEALPDLKFNIYYPRDIMERNTPVPVISWGNGGCMTFDWMSTTLLERWAAAGFVVVTYNDPAAKNQSLGVEALTAAQIRMLDWAEEANVEGGRFAGKLDTERMVVGGNSCGGVTAFNVAWADKRPKAIFIVSGSTQFPGVTDEVRKASAGRVELPTLYIVGGPEDIARTPVRLEYESLRPGLPAVLIERSSGDHGAVSNDPDIQRDEAAMAINWFRTILYGDKVAAKELATKGCAACDQKVWSVRSKNLPK